MGGVFRAMQQYAGLSQARIAAATGLSHSRVNEVINGRREITKLDVFERVADGLGIPAESRRILGLAPARTSGHATLPTSRPIRKSSMSTATRASHERRSRRSCRLPRASMCLRSAALVCLDSRIRYYARDLPVAPRPTYASCSSILTAT
ncbi:helix-turn-helix domain-containing protein [Nocardioides sp. NPDC127503]|uniref:helix-turn-helix domain-containing protein n=1 Tax=Nocardioides sp. NPDC127503 TaxID=3154516 RepID=UPI003320D76D